MGVGPVVAQGVGDVGPAAGAEQTDERVVEGRQCLGEVAAALLADVLPKRHVADPVDAVLDRPVRAPVGGDAGDGDGGRG